MTEMTEWQSTCQVFVVLALEPGANAWKGLVENSFTMDFQDSRVRLWCTGTYYSFLGEHKLDGREDADEQQRHYAQRHPLWRVEVFDARSDECPIQINWERWSADSNRGDKFGSRNAQFEIREEGAGR